MGRRVDEFLAGCRDEAPLQLGVIPFGMLYGIGALAAGMPVWLAQLTSMLVFAGAAQLVIVQMLAAGAGALPIVLTASLLGMSVGGAALLATLYASASYIAAPAAMRIAVPEANPALSIGAALGITFPFNVMVGIPTYHWLASRVGGMV